MMSRSRGLTSLLGSRKRSGRVRRPFPRVAARLLVTAVLVISTLPALPARPSAAAADDQCGVALAPGAPAAATTTPQPGAPQPGQNGPPQPGAAQPTATRAAQRTPDAASRPPAQGSSGDSRPAATPVTVADVARLRAVTLTRF